MTHFKNTTKSIFSVASQLKIRTDAFKEILINALTAVLMPQLQ